MGKKRFFKLLTLDTETYGLDGEIKRIAIYDGERVEYGYKFEDIELTLERLWREKCDTHIYIHNLEFDARKMPKVFERGNVLWGKTKVIGGKYVTISCKHYTLHDSFRLLPDSLKNLSKSFGVEHGKLDLWDEVEKSYPNQYLDIEDYFKRCNADDPLYLKYLGYDVMSLYEILLKICDVAGIEPVELSHIMTTASLSKYVFKNGYKGKPFKNLAEKTTDYEILCTCKAWGSHKLIGDNMGVNDVTFAEVEDKLRAGYFGGRTEVFIPKLIDNGEDIKAYYYDVNSLYPSQMLKHVPVGYPEFYDTPEMIEDKFNTWQDHSDGLGFIKAEVYIPKQNIGPLPVRKEKLFFPTGHICGTFTYIELDYAIKYFGVKVERYMEMIHFKKTYPVFKNFVELFAPMKTKAKEAGEKALETFCKLVQNTGYGYTCLRRDNKTELKDILEIDKVDPARLLFTDETLGFLEMYSIVRSPTIQVQVGAYITSYARLTLLKMLKHQNEIGHIYYCDTDSIVCSEPLPPEYVHHSKLGFWDLEDELYNGYFLQPKVYTTEGASSNKIKFKGVTKQTQKKFNYDFYEQLYYKLCSPDVETVEVESGIPVLRGIKYTQKKGLDANILEYRDKKIKLLNKQKRNMDYAGNRSEPWHFETLEEFNAFNFGIDYEKYRREDGNLLDLCEGSRK